MWLSAEALGVRAPRAHPSVAEHDAATAPVAARSLLPLVAIAIVALVVRLAWMAWHGPSEIASDGAEYARIAINLLHGHGYIGLRGGTMFVFPPLYPIAIAALTAVLGDAERAGVWVSLISGAALVFPCFGIAALLYGRRAGYAAAVIAALLPFTVQLSTTVLSDQLFLTLAATGLYFLLRAVRDGSWWVAAACGAAFGLAYLTRPEGLLLEVLAVAVIVVWATSQREGVRPAFIRVVAVALPFLILAAPYVAFLSSHAGHLRVEGKSYVNLDIGLRIDRGMTYDQAADAIDRNLAQVGPELRDDYYFEPTDRVKTPLSTIVAFAARNTVHHFAAIFLVAKSRLCGSVLLLLLAIVGFAAPPWSRKRLESEAILVLYGLVILASLASVNQFWERYFVGFIPLFVVWAARGVDVVTTQLARRFPSRIVRAAPLVAVALFLGVLVFTSKTRFTDDSASLMERTLGTWLADHGAGGATMLSVSDQSVYYAGGTWEMLPVAPDAETALNYVRLRHPGFIILDEEYVREGRDYAQNWLENGIPDPHAHIIDRVQRDGKTIATISSWQ